MLTTVVRIVAPFWMAATAFVAAVAGIALYWAMTAVAVSLPIDVPEAIAIPLFVLYVASPIVLALIMCGRVSRVMYRADSAATPTVLLHLWHCALLYALAGWTLFSLVTCPGPVPPVPGYCADPLGASMAAGIVALGGILADAFAAYRRYRPLAIPVG